MYYSMLFPTVGWPMISALAANLAYLYTLPLCTFFSSLYHNVVIQSTLLQYYDIKLIKGLLVYSIKIEGLVLFSKAGKKSSNPAVVLNKVLVEVAKT